MQTPRNSPSAYRVAVKGLAKDANGRILFVRERSDSWDLPGGGLEHGESPQQALHREFEEELAVKIKIESSTLQAFSTWNTKFDDPVLLLIYACRLLREPSLTSEVAEFRFFNAAELTKISLDSTLNEAILRQLT